MHNSYLCFHCAHTYSLLSLSLSLSTSFLLPLISVSLYRLSNGQVVSLAGLCYLSFLFSVDLLQLLSTGTSKNDVRCELLYRRTCYVSIDSIIGNKSLCKLNLACHWTSAITIKLYLLCEVHFLCCRYCDDKVVINTFQLVILTSINSQD